MKLLKRMLDALEADLVEDELEEEDEELPPEPTGEREVLPQAEPPKATVVPDEVIEKPPIESAS